MAEAPQEAGNACQTCGPLQQAALNERLLKAVVAISGCATLEGALEPLLDAALDVTRMDGGGVYWVEGDVAVLRHHRGLPDAFIREVTRMPLTPVPVEVLLRQRQPLEIAGISPAMRNLCRRHGVRHAFSFPLRAGDALFGFLNVASIHSGAPEPADIQALLILVNEIQSLFFRLYSERALRESNERLEEQVQARTAELNQTIDRLRAAMVELERRAAQLQNLTLELVRAEDCERSRLAEFLHDDLQQTLAAAKFHVGVLRGRVGGDETAVQALAQTTQMLKEAIEKSRNLSHELGPPVLCRGSLEAVFEWLAGQMESKHGLTVHLDIRDHADSDCEPVKSFLYRAAREILFNAVKHAWVREIKLRLQRVHRELWLTLSDRGRGFEPASLDQATGFGLPTIRERVELLGGRMTIKSAPGKGSIFFIAVPDIHS